MVLYLHTIWTITKNTMVKHLRFRRRFNDAEAEEPISGPPAWRFSVTLARVRAKPKETRTERRVATERSRLVGGFEPWENPWENGDLSHRTLGNSEEQWRFYVNHGDLYGMYSWFMMEKSKLVCL